MISAAIPLRSDSSIEDRHAGMQARVVELEGELGAALEEVRRLTGLLAAAEAQGREAEQKLKDAKVCANPLSLRGGDI